MPEPDFTVGQFDTADAMAAVLLDSSGVPRVIDEAETVTFRMRKFGAAVPVVDAEATVGEGVGEVSYQWQAGDLDLVGFHAAQFVVTTPGDPDTVETFPNGSFILVYVHPSVGEGP